MITSSFLPSERNVCRVGLLERLALHTPYPAIAARISDIVRRLPRGHTTVIVDRTGAHAAYDMLVEKGLSPIGLTISGGDSVHWDRRYVTVPKMRLLTGLLSICSAAISMRPATVRMEIRHRGNGMIVAA